MPLPQTVCDMDDEEEVTTMEDDWLVEELEGQLTVT